MRKRELTFAVRNMNDRVLLFQRFSELPDEPKRPFWHRVDGDQLERAFGSDIRHFCN